MRVAAIAAAIASAVSACILAAQAPTGLFDAVEVRQHASAVEDAVETKARELRDPDPQRVDVTRDDPRRGERVNISDILRHKGADIVSITPSDTVTVKESVLPSFVVAEPVNRPGPSAARDTSANSSPR